MTKPPAEEARKPIRWYLLAVKCPICGAEPRRMCKTNTRTRTPAHDGRKVAAKEKRIGRTLRKHELNRMFPHSFEEVFGDCQ